MARSSPRAWSLATADGCSLLEVEGTGKELLLARGFDGNGLSGAGRDGDGGDTWVRKAVKCWVD